MKKYLLLLVALIVSTMSFAQGTEDNPAVLNANQTFTMPGSGWSHYYFTYTCELTGTLKFSGGSGFDVGVNAAASYDNAYGHYDDSEYKFVQKIDVTEGETYTLDLYMYAGDNVTIELPRVIKDGDIDKPFDLTSGSVNLGTDAGTVWGTYTPEESGKATFSGNEGIVTAVRVFSSLSNAKYYISYGNDSSDASSESNTVTADVTAGKTYYVAITKIDSPMGNTFKTTFAEYQEGDAKEKPIDATASPYTTTLAAGAKVWFKVAETSAAAYKLLAVTAGDEANISYGYYYDAYGNTYWQSMSSYTGSLNETIGNDWYDCSYLVCVENPTDAAMDVTINVSEIEEGDSPKKPIALTLGETYTVNKEGDRYYSYTFNGGEVVAFEMPEGAYVECSSFWGTKANEGSTYVFSYDYSYSFTFTVKGMKAGDTFKFVEGQLPVGSSINNPVVLDGDTYTFDATTTSIWIEYTATETGSLMISSDIPYSFDNNVRYYVNGNSKGYLDNASKYEQLVGVTAGDKVQVNLVLASPAEGKVVTFKPYVPGEGEYYTTAIQVYADQEFTVPAGKTVWYKFEALNSGAYDVTFYASNSGITTTLYTSLSNAENGYYNNVYMTDWGDGNGPMSTPYLQAGVNYIKVYNYQDADVTLKLTGNLTDLHEHVYADAWSYNDNYHWHACTGSATCKEVSDYAEHTLDANRTCTVCGFVKPYTVTVADGEVTNQHCPADISWADTEGTQTSCVYNSSLLTELAGKEVTSLKYYLTALTNASTAVFDVYMTEVDETVLTATPTDLGTKVYEGTFSYDSNNYLNIVLDTPYKYNGGNLMISTVVATAGNWVTTTFYGVSTDEAVSYYSRQGGQAFLPKTTFGYNAVVADGIADVNASNTSVAKFVKNGQVLIQKNGQIFNANGQMMK